MIAAATYIAKSIQKKTQIVADYMKYQSSAAEN